MFRSALTRPSPSLPVFISRLTLLWLLAIATVILLLVFNQALMNARIQQQEEEIVLVRLSARQRTYSQQIAFLSLRLATTSNLSQRAELRGDLAVAIGSMRRDHQNLAAYADSIPALQALYFSSGELAARVDTYLDAAERLVNVLMLDVALDQPDLLLIENAAPALLDDLLTVNNIFHAASLDSARALTIANQTGTIVLLLILAGQSWFIIRPMMQRLHHKAELLTAEIAERQRVEAELHAKQRFIRQITETAPNLVFIYDLVEQRNIFINQSVFSLLGYTAHEFEAMGSTLLSTLLHPDDLQTVVAHNEQYHRLADGERAEIEYRVQHRAGHWLWLHVVSVVFERDTDGRVLQVLGTAHDVTQLKLADQQAADLKVERARMRFLTEFMTNISHDFRTPLAIINSSAYIISKLTDETRRQEKVNIISKQVERMEHLLTQVLFTARLDNSDEYHMTRVHLNELIENSLASLTPEYRRNHQVTVQVADFDIFLNGNMALLERALVNLLENALVYTPSDGSVMLTVACEDSYCILEIRDTGIGIAPQDLPRIFEPFYRGDQARAASTGGMGLGLTMVKKIVDLHHGDISINSQPGQGTAVRLYIPLFAVMQSV